MINGTALTEIDFGAILFDEENPLLSEDVASLGDYVPFDEDGSVAADDERRRNEDIDQKAVEGLFWRDVKRRTDELETERSGKIDTWKPVDIGDLFDTEQQEPDVGAFIDDELSNGGALFYSGKVNEIHGPSESGKTMVLLAVAAQEVRLGHDVVMIDYEDDGRSIVNRLRWVFGLQREEIEKHFRYIRPEVTFNAQAFESLREEISGASFCIIDAATEAMSLEQLDGRNENDVATWYNQLPKRLADLGMAVCVVDHTPQDNNNRQIGSQHKKAGISGVSYTAEPVAPFTRGGRGCLRLRVAKDRVGAVRAAALPGDNGGQFWRGDFVIDGRLTPDSPAVKLTGVDPRFFDGSAKDTGQARDVKAPELPTAGQAPMLLALAKDGEWLSCKAAGTLAGIKGTADYVRTAPRKIGNKLVERGMAERKMVGTTLFFKVSQSGLHSANAWEEERSRDPQEALPIMGSEGGSEPKPEPKVRTQRTQPEPKPEPSSDLHEPLNPEN